MIKKTISFTLIILLMLLVYQFVVNLAKSSHYVTYKIDKGELFNIDEKYNKEKGKDYYLIKVTNNDKNFVWKVENKFNKQKNIVSDIEIFEQDDYYCLGLVFVGDKYYSYSSGVKSFPPSSSPTILQQKILLLSHVYFFSGLKIINSKIKLYLYSQMYSQKKDCFGFILLH